MSITYEQVAEIAQKYVSTCPVVIVGTGASVPHGLPSMTELAQELQKRVLVSKDKTDVGRWEKFKAKLAESDDLEKALHDVELTTSLLDQVVRETWAVINEREFPVRNAVLSDIHFLPLTRLFRYLLRTAQASISVITTNYDRLIEYAANAAESVYFTGFTNGIIGGFISDSSFNRCSHQCPGSQGHILLWKVHGSLDWFENLSKEPLAINGAQDIPNSHRPLIVTPGLTKYRETHLDPFRTVIAKADQALDHAKSYLCIGYGFNDEHIQPKLISRLTKNDIPIIVVTKTLTQAGKSLLLSKPSKKFLIFEEAGKHTKVYHPGSIEGEILIDYKLWSLPGFMDMVIGPS